MAAHPTYLDSAGLTRSRKGTAAAGTEGDPDVTMMRLDLVTAPAALADNTVTPTSVLIGSCGMVYDGATWDMARGTAVDGALVNLGTNNDVTITSGTVTTVTTCSTVTNLSQLGGAAVPIGAGTEAAAIRFTLANDSTGVLATVSTVTTCTTLTGGGIAHGGVDSGNPHKVGAIATASVLGGTPVDAADRTNVVAGTDGVLFMRPHTSLEDILSLRVTNTDGAATDLTGVFAATASQRIHLTSIIICNSSSTNCTVDILDGTGGTILMTLPVPANGGVVFNPPVPLRFTANKCVTFDASGAITTLSLTFMGFKSKT